MRFEICKSWLQVCNHQKHIESANEREANSAKTAEASECNFYSAISALTLEKSVIVYRKITEG